MRIISLGIMRKNKYEGKTAALHSAPCHTEPLRKFNISEESLENLGNLIISVRFKLP